MAPPLLSPRAHIQNLSEASALEPHWGYADRAMPCTNDAGSCRYLDVVYRSHDLGMYYVGIIWATLGALLLVWAIGRRVLHPQSSSSVQLPVPAGETPNERERRSALERLQRAVPAYARRYLLPDAARPVFGRTTRTQVLVLAVLTGYLAVWSFVGIAYGKWVTPVKKMPGVYNTRTSLGPWADRIGVIAYALTPLSVILSSRESILSLVTGLPYQSFNFLHRWLGYIIFAQSALHTVGWCVVELRLYQPQPSVGVEWIKQLYMVWGVVAMILLTLMVVLSTPWGIRLTGYEFFRKAHYVLAMLYIGACWGHWAQLKVFLLPSLLVWFLDRAIRLVRTALLHYNFLPSGHMGFRCATASVSFFPDAPHGDMVRLDFEHPHDAWAVGQHFYLTFPESSVWQSHPFTPLSRPVFNADAQHHSYVFRAKKGETKRIAALSARRALKSTVKEAPDGSAPAAAATLSVVLNGPYGEATTRALPPSTNVLCIAGGTGITYVLPVLLDLAARPPTRDRRITLVWVVRHARDLEWVAPELAVLKREARTSGLRVHIYVTRATEDSGSDGSTVSAGTGPSHSVSAPVSGFDEKAPAAKEDITSSSLSSSTSSSALSVHGTSKAALDHVQNRPDLQAVVQQFVEGTVRGRTQVFASGPGEMISELRRVVAGSNSGAQVWRGEERWDVGLTCDDRLEW
ncbi:ferric reductase NAD binding domain-containing protein [Massariosphaeria phaeospora]|uniref:Ferric reductase NAD binding domain-containing protein n=1 Tax=Massariosphaeria phaeospora TaxID=100035 RepID=A0A7C8ICD9_9PLEO|nr:ferric reductase NAD binding domain-containing protein [Massariosphaeria phaeospora]